MAYNPNNANGQATMANSAPVVIASNQSAVPVSGTITASNTAGDVAAGSADSGNPVKVGGKFNSTQPTLTDGQRGDIQLTSRGEVRSSISNGATTAAVNTGADGASGAAGLVVNGRGQVYNGTNWDLARGAANATNSTGTGIQAAAVLGQFDDTSPTAITENQFGNLRMSANRNLYGTIRDAAGNERGANVNASNELLVALSSVPSHAVTNAGTFAVQADNTKIGGNNISTDVGVTGNGTQRMVLANGAGRTLLSTGGSASSSGNNTLVAAGTNKLKVYAFSLSTTSTTAVTCIFQSGASGTELWRVVLQAPTSVSTGANLVVQPPAWLFATASATLLNLNLSGAQTVHWSVSYFDEA